MLYPPECSDLGKNAMSQLRVMDFTLQYKGVILVTYSGSVDLMIVKHLYFD